MDSLGYYYFFWPSVVKILRVKNMKLKTKVGMARGPVLYRQKQSFRVVTTNYYYYYYY